MEAPAEVLVLALSVTGTSLWGGSDNAHPCRHCRALTDCKVHVYEILNLIHGFKLMLTVDGGGLQQLFPSAA